MGVYRAFETIEAITPAAALVLAAEYERLLLRRNPPLFVANTRAWAPEVMHTLKEIGFFEIVGFRGPHRETDYTADRFVLPMRSGNTTDTEAIADLIDSLKQLYPDRDNASEASLVHLYGAMVEAIGNVIHHAYPTGATYAFPPAGRWWMTGAVDREARSTTAVVFDQGITIPLSLPAWRRFSGVQTRLRTKIAELIGTSGVPALGLYHPSDPRLDADAIAAAVEESVTSTLEPHRGHGLAQMRNFVDQCRDGRLRIMSRHGEVIYRPGKPPETRTFNVSVGGTLIEWSVSL